MDSWVILDSMKAGEGQKERQRELTHQSKNPVVQTEQRVSSVALTIHGAKVPHYKMLFSPFCSIQANCKKNIRLHGIIPRQGWAASRAQVPIAVQTVMA